MSGFAGGEVRIIYTRVLFTPPSFSSTKRSKTRRPFVIVAFCAIEEQRARESERNSYRGSSRDVSTKEKGEIRN